MVNWDIEELTGYQPITTFYKDFSIADRFGLKAVKDTYNRALKEWKTEYKYMTELVMVLNWKCWQHYRENNRELSKLYSDLFGELSDWCFENLKGNELEYFIRTTD